MVLIEDTSHGFALESSAMDTTDRYQLMEALVLKSAANQTVERVRGNTVQKLVRSRGHVSDKASPLTQTKARIDEAMATIASMSSEKADVEIDGAISSAAKAISENHEAHERIKRELEEMLES